MRGFVSCPACAYYAVHGGTLCPQHEWASASPHRPRLQCWLTILLVSLALAALGSAALCARAEEVVAPTEKSEGAVREEAFAATLAEVSEHHGCKAVKAWESIARWIRAVEFNCDGLSVVQLLAWDGQRWLRSELFAPQDPSMVR